jgi:hypothetical protein
MPATKDTKLMYYIRYVKFINDYCLVNYRKYEQALFLALYIRITYVNQIY